MSVNGETCWSKTGLVGTSGSQKCGGFFKEELFRVTGCYVTLEAEMPMTVRVWTSLDMDALDESFAINNVVIQLLGKGICSICCRGHYEDIPVESCCIRCCPYVSLLTARPAMHMSTFYNKYDFDGWNCDNIHTCGDWGQVCGGFGEKGKGSDIKKTFTLPAGTYSVQLDFIRIDSWFVSVRSSIHSV